MSAIGGAGGVRDIPRDPGIGTAPASTPDSPVTPATDSSTSTSTSTTTRIATPTPRAPAASGARRAIEPAVYGPIFEEARAAEWRGAGIDPVRYVEDRLDRDRFLGALASDPRAKVVLHRQALKIGDVTSIVGSRTRNVTHADPKDYPGRVYFSPDDGAFHVVGIAGEDWFRQTLHMLATAGVPAAKIDVEGVFDPGAIVARDLDATLAAHDFDSVTVGTMGELSRGVERVLRERARPAHEAKVLRDMETFLDGRVRDARPDRRPRFEEARARLAALRAEGGTTAEQIARIEADPVVRGPLGELLRVAREGPASRDLPWRFETGRQAQVLAHRVLEVDGKKHLLVHIGGAHGDMAYHTVRHVLAKEPGLGRVNMYGSAGSFSTRIPPDTFILPQGTVRSAESDRAPVAVRNRAALAGAVPVTHSNVSTLLREHRAGLSRLMALPADSVDIESYHVARAVAEASRPVDFRAILRVSDVATSADLGAHRVDRGATSDYDARRAGEEKAVVALGLVEGAP